VSWDRVYSRALSQKTKVYECIDDKMTELRIYYMQSATKHYFDIKRLIQGSFANCNISLGLDLFNEGITEYI